LAMPGQDTSTLERLLQEMGETIDCPKMIDVMELLTESLSAIHCSDRKSIQDHFQSNNLGNTTDWLSTTVLHTERLLFPSEAPPLCISPINRISHICFTSGSTGIPKGCQSSIFSLRHYLSVKNAAHAIQRDSTVLLASALSFDPCLSDILATFSAGATLVMVSTLVGDVRGALDGITHVLCTPTLWSVLTADIGLKDVPDLRAVALGGEPISKRIIAKWARHQSSTRRFPRLCATYGVTEACVYQTMGEIFAEDDALHVGACFDGLQVKIDSSGDSTSGEVVMFGKQVDELSGYLNRPELTKEKFGMENGQYYYRTGDLGHLMNGKLHILGRIQGEEGMVKVNGVRIELGEVEAALVDEGVVSDCMAVVRTQDDEDSSKQVHAFLVLTTTCLEELKLSRDIIPETGVICSTGPLLVLLRARCKLRVRAAAMPSAFILIPRVPLSPTGKCDRRRLPALIGCTTLKRLMGGDVSSNPLREYGKSGAVVAEQIIECLNLQGCQKEMLTTTANFAMLGGDSLGSTRIVRSLYAYHHDLQNRRELGGSFGAFEGPFAVIHLLSSKTMQEYVDWLDSNGVCGPKNVEKETSSPKHDSYQEKVDSPVVDNLIRQQSEQYDALLESITLSQFSIALELLQVGVDPNFGAHGGRLSKISHRNDRRKKFTSNPLHLVCGKGNPQLVRKLLEKGCKFNAPDASGLFPMHIAASGTPAEGISAQQDDLQRKLCLVLLLNAGAPLSMKDGNKQTLLHCAARAGHVECLRYLLLKWKQGLVDGTIYYYNDKHKGGEYDWTDHWYRTPVHWAVLNGKVDALTALLEGGCSAEPPMPSKKRDNNRTSAELETPLDICERKYGESQIGDAMKTTLLIWKERQEHC
jgi:acyl-CoA synthetase (AMP-forming)/AMP-acid ligase II/ankyrin repeat protein